MSTFTTPSRDDLMAITEDRRVALAFEGLFRDFATLSAAVAAQRTNRLLLVQSVEAATGGTLNTGDTIANSTADNLFATNVVVPAGDLNTVGLLLKGRACFRYTTNGSTPTIRVKTKLGSVVIDDTGTFTVRNLGGGVAAIIYDFMATVRSVGAAGTLIGCDFFSIDFSNFSADRSGVSGAVDLTAAQTLQFSATWSAASANNSITMEQCAVWLEGSGA